MSPLVIAVLGGHPAALILPPGLVVLGDIPAVSIEVVADLKPHSLSLEQFRQEARARGAATLSGFIRKGDEVRGEERLRSS